jgi:steroid 5-alpha reductase family enzyme
VKRSRKVGTARKCSSSAGDGNVFPVTPLLLVVLIAGGASAFAWIASLISGDTSWVDRSWSIVPVIYVWVFAAFGHLSNPRLDLMAGLVTIWGVRLTFNFARRGGYTGFEDYRWPVLRASMSKWQFQVFNFFFIVLYQNFLLVLITLPILTAYQHRATPLRPLDVLLGAAFLACTVTETIADQQQWNFQQWKLAEVKAGREPVVRFVQTGLFRYSRHPNYFYEQAQWWILFLFGAVAAGSLLEWTFLGAFLLSLLFLGSTNFTEKLTLERYPEYALYQKSTSAMIPWTTQAPRSIVQTAPSD